MLDNDLSSIKQLALRLDSTKNDELQSAAWKRLINRIEIESQTWVVEYMPKK
jgi:hypothetical protein